MRAGKAAEELPDGPVDEEVQEGLVEAFRQQQEVQERLFSSLLVIISLPLFVFFVWHSYQQLLDPWSWPFSGLKEADQFGRMLASSAHVITGLSIILSFVSTLAHKKLREFRKALLIVACVLVVLVSNRTAGAIETTLTERHRRGGCGCVSCFQLLVFLGNMPDFSASSFFYRSCFRSLLLPSLRTLSKERAQGVDSHGCALAVGSGMW